MNNFFSKIKGLQNQRKIIIISLLAIIIMCLFPPWKYIIISTESGSSTEYPVGYSFIITPPDKKDGGFFHGVKIDITRLLIQFIIIGCSSICLILIDQKSND